MDFLDEIENEAQPQNLNFMAFPTRLIYFILRAKPVLISSIDFISQGNLPACPNEIPRFSF